MTVYTTENPKDNIFSEIKLSDTAVALGGFDAMHKGHTEIISGTVDYAKKHGLTSVVYMFRNNPMSVSGGGALPINTFGRRLEILKELGVDTVIAQWFTADFKEVTAENFFNDYLRDALDAKYLASGFNYHFGKNGGGDVTLLKKMASAWGVKVHTVPCISICGAPVSSTRIRTLVSSGGMAEAAQCLGRYFSISGKVIHGNEIGRTLGFPTANIALPTDIILPKRGVYITRTCVGGEIYPSITNVGARPTVNSKEAFVETYLSGFDGNLYEREIRVEFCEYLRDIAKFSSLDTLKDRLNKDKMCLEHFSDKRL